MSIEAMKQWLEALEYADACLKKQLTAKTKHEYAQDLLLSAGTSLRQAIEEAEKQEPVAECVDDGEGGVYYKTLAPKAVIGNLYTHPQPKADHIPDATKMVEQEPVAWQGRMDNESEWENLDDEKQAHWRRDSCGYEIRALYTEPQPKAEQEPLARERAIVDLIVAEHGYPKEFKEFEAALKARNNTTSQTDQDEVDIRSRLYQRIYDLETQLAKQEQVEPVAWRISYPNDPELGFWFAEGIGGEGCLNEPLYTTPQQGKPLTVEQFQVIRNSLFRQDGWDGDGWDLALKEAIEAAHGIKE
jgi:hypothetical protein